MDQDVLFASVGFTPVIYKGKKKYQGPDKRYYSLETTDHYFGIWITGHDGKNSDLRRFYRIFDDSMSEQILREYIRKYPYEDVQSRGTVQMYQESAALIRKLIGMKLNKLQWENLCRLYSDAVRAGGHGQILADTCKEVIQILEMKDDEYVDPDLHRLLLNIPDTYYDFIIGTELALDGYPKIQQRLFDAIQRHPEASTSDVIVYSSILISNPNDSEEHLEAAVNYYRENRDFEILNTPDEKNELTQERNKGGWKVTTIFVRGFGFTLRQSGPIIFIDYQSRCVGGVVLRSVSDTEAGIVALEVGNIIHSDVIREKLLQYAERVVLAAGKKSISVCCPPNDRDFFTGQGYSASEEEREVFLKDF